MNTIKELYSEANKIVSDVFNVEEWKVVNVTVSVIAQTYSNSELYFGLSYFVQKNASNIHGSINGKSVEEAIEKLILKANFDKDNFRIDKEFKGKPTIDIEFGI